MDNLKCKVCGKDMLADMETQHGFGDERFRVFVCTSCGFKKNPWNIEEIKIWETLDRLVYKKNDMRNCMCLGDSEWENNQNSNVKKGCGCDSSKNCNNNLDTDKSHSCGSGCRGRKH